jgi:hypothetical protein
MRTSIAILSLIRNEPTQEQNSMTQAYSDPSRETDPPHALPDIEVFELTPDEVAQLDEELIHEYRQEFPLSSMSQRERQKMLDAIVEREGIGGGWFWQACFPGCLPDSDPIGPFPTYAEALADAQDNCAE